MQVIVKPYLFIRQALGEAEILIDLKDGSTVFELLNVLRRDHGLPEAVKVGRQELKLFSGSKLIGLIVLIEGRNIKQLDELKTKLKEGDTITLFPPAAGG